MKAHLDDVTDCALPESSIMAMFAGQQHEQSLWSRYADRITTLLQVGLPKCCVSEKPKSGPLSQAKVMDHARNHVGQQHRPKTPLGEDGVTVITL
jgi:hypothetical protein